MTRAAVAEAMGQLDSAKVSVTKAYESSRTVPLVADLPAGHRVVPIYNFPPTANPPISTVRNRDAFYVLSIAYNSSAAMTASVVLTIGGTGNLNLDGKFIGVFGAGKTDGTIIWTCGTAAAATSETAGAIQALYPYLPPPCQH